MAKWPVGRWPSDSSRWPSDQRRWRTWRWRNHSLAKSPDTIYDFHIFTNVYSPLHGFISNQHNDQFPVGLLAQLVERYIGIAEVMGSNHVQAWIFFRPCLFHHCSSSVRYCEDRFHIHVFICSSNIWLSYIQIRLILLLRLLLIMIIIIVIIRIIIINMCFPNPYFVFSTPSNPLVDEY